MMEETLYLNSNANETLYKDINTKAKFKNRFAEPFYLDPSFHWTVALFEVHFPHHPRDGRAIHVTENNAGIIYIYLDFIKTTRVGDALTRLLRTVHCFSSFQTPANLRYIPIPGGEYPEMGAKLCKVTGELYPFARSEHPLQLGLHFKTI